MHHIGAPGETFKCLIRRRSKQEKDKGGREESSPPSSLEKNKAISWIDIIKLNLFNKFITQSNKNIFTQTSASFKME